MRRSLLHLAVFSLQLTVITPLVAQGPSFGFLLGRSLVGGGDSRTTIRVYTALAAAASCRSRWDWVLTRSQTMERVVSAAWRQGRPDGYLFSLPSL
jgi:hypothetical protein